MSNLLFDRDIQLTLFAPALDTGRVFDRAFHIMFSMERTLKKGSVNSGTVTIYNLNKTSRALFEEKDSRLLLEVGYKGNTLSKLIDADILWSDSYKEGVDWLTEIHIGEGAKDLRGLFISRSYSGKVSSSKIIKDVVAKMENTVQGALKAGKEHISKNGLSLTGTADVILDKLSNVMDADISIQNNELIVLDDESLVDDLIIHLTPKTGLLGAPRKFKNEKKKKKKKKTENLPLYGTRFTCLIIPDLYPGRGVRLTYANGGGFYKVYTAKYTGSNFDNQWDCQVEAYEL